MAPAETKKRRKFDINFKEDVLKYAAKHSGEQTARHFNIDSKRIRYWRKQKTDLATADKSRARLSGGGRKKVSEELDTKLSEWMGSMKKKNKRVSRKMIRNKAREIYPTVSDTGVKFVASGGWLQKFLERSEVKRLPSVSTASPGTKRRRKFDLQFKEDVLKYAAEHSGEQAARHFKIDSKRIRYWRKQKTDLATADKNRARLAGGGRKKISEQLDIKLSEWIDSMRNNRNRVSRKMVQNKALEIYSTVNDTGAGFVASGGWLQRFLDRHYSTLRHRSTVDQNDQDVLTQKLVSFVDYVGKTITSKGISEKHIIAMDETAVWFDMLSPSPSDKSDTTLKTTEYEKSPLTVVLSAKADGTKFQPFVVFRGAVHEVEAMQQETSKAVLTSSDNGCMNDDLTVEWIRSVVGKGKVCPRLLVWDAYRCHISAATRRELRRIKISTAVIPPGCTKYIQAPDVMWNKPFTASLHASFSEWLIGSADKQYTSRGNLKAPSRRLLVDWVLTAWDKLDKDLIIKSFKVCGQSVKPDGSEDDLIQCFQEGQPCAAGLQALSFARLWDKENRRPAEPEEDTEELYNNEFFDDEEKEITEEN